MQKSILVTGGAGYIGSHAVLALKDNGWYPVVIDNLVTGFRGAVPQDVPLVEGNIADHDLVSATIKKYNIIAAMHFAGSADVAAAHDFNYSARRYFNVAGADPKGRTGQSTAGATHLIKVAVEAALGKRDSISIFGTDYDTEDGTGVRDYIHVSDLAAAHVIALEKLIDSPKDSHILNCGYGHGFSVTQVLDAVDRVTNNKLVRNLEPRRAGDPDALISDNSKIKQRFGWTPKYDDLNLIVKHALAWEQRLIENPIA